MRRYLWKIAGADCEIIEKSGKDSQYSFWLIGFLYLIINVLSYMGFFGMFIGVFDKIVPTILGTLVLGFLVTNIYRINLISLEPNTLPVKNDSSSLLLTNIIRYSTVVLFAFFVSKSVEMVIISFFESTGFIDYDGSKGYMDHMSEMNKSQPWIWLITCLIILLFVTPIYLRHRLNRAHEYYILRRIRDKELVKKDFQKAKATKEDLFHNLYREYKKVNIDKSYVPPIAKYSDEPFNTKEIISSKKTFLKTSEEFIHLNDWDLK